MKRRDFVAAGAGAALPAAGGGAGSAQVKFGIDLFSIRSSGWSPFEYLDYCARRKAAVVHFSEVRFLGSLEEAHLRKVREHAERLGIELEIGMRSICPSSKQFDPKQGTAEEQLLRMAKAAKIAGASIVRAFLGSAEDRKGPVPIDGHIENTVKVLRAARSQVLDAGLKVAVENHAGDMQARELKTLIEEAGKDFVGACIDSGNPLWTLEDPHLTLEVLHPYVLTSHIRDTAVWRVPEGVAVKWVRMGEGNVRIDEYVRKYAELCPGRALSLEIIVYGPRMFNYLDPKFWDGYRSVRAWEFARFLALAEAGHTHEGLPPAPKEQAAEREREDLEASIRHCHQLLGI
jgi:sugar phosphate isomerase/epimerase